MSEPTLPAEPKLIDNTERALEVLTPNIIARINLYGVNGKFEHAPMPEAAFLTPDEWRALELVIRVARQTITPKRHLKTNLWGNVNGYENNRKVKEFGTDSINALEWVEYRN